MGVSANNIQVHPYTRIWLNCFANETSRWVLDIRYVLWVVVVDEARAEWRFWIGQGFQRITDVTDKGWKYTEDMRKPFPLSAYLSARKRCVVEKMVNGIKIKPKETA